MFTLPCLTHAPLRAQQHPFFFFLEAALASLFTGALAGAAVVDGCSLVRSTVMGAVGVVPNGWNVKGCGAFSCGYATMDAVLGSVVVGNVTMGAFNVGA